jgi:TPR repeat protein
MRAFATAIFLYTVLGLSLQFPLAAETNLAQLPSVGPEGPSAGSAALVRLGDIYFAGELVRQDFKAAISFYRQAAEKESPTGRIRLGEMIARGQGVAQDPELGKAMVRAVAETGNADAFLSLGDLYSQRDAGPIEASPAIGAYEAAGALGNSEAFIRLGNLYYEGSVGRVDLPKAFDSYRRAADANNSAGKRRVGEMLARGQGTKQDISIGRATVREVAETGDAHAYLALGDLYLRGDGGPIDGAAAITAYRAAVALANTQAMVKLGDLYRTGTIVQANRQKAINYYREAVNAGNAYGLFALGRGYFEGEFPKKGGALLGIKMLLEAQRAGVEEAIVLLSESHLEGRGTRGDPREGLAVLKRAFGAGNLAAGQQLVRVYRDGRKIRNVSVVRRDKAQARFYLHALKDQLDPGRLASEQLLLDLAEKRGRKDYSQIQSRLETISPRDRPSFLRQLRTVHPNAYVFLLQEKLKTSGLYRGASSGQLNRETIRGFRRYCASINAENICRHGPLSGQAADVLSFAF